MGMIPTNLNGLDLDARLDMSLFRGLVDRVRQDLGFAEGVDESRTPSSRSACIICSQDDLDRKRTGQHEVVAVDRVLGMECPANTPNDEALTDSPTTMSVNWTPFFACFLPLPREAMGEPEAERPCSRNPLIVSGM